MLGIRVNVMVRSAAWGHRLLATDLRPDEARRIGTRFLVGPVADAYVTVVALVAPALALALCLLLDLLGAEGRGAGSVCGLPPSP